MNESGLESEHQAVGHKEDLGPSPWKYGYRKYPLGTSPVSESDLCLYHSGPVVKPNSTMESELGHWTLRFTTQPFSRSSTPTSRNTVELDSLSVSISPRPMFGKTKVIARELKRRSAEYN